MARPEPVSLAAKDIHLSFGTNTVLRGVDLDVPAGTTTAIIGPSGSGKSTLLRCLNRLYEPDRGDILLDGRSVLNDDPDALRQRIGMVFQHFNLFPHRTALDNIIESPVHVKGVKKAVALERARELLSQVGLAGKEEAYPAQLSGGQQQRVALARALAPAPKVLLLDEPLSALDLKLRQAMRVELKQLQEDSGITFIFVTHDQEEALTMSDRIAVMSAGQVQQIGSAREIYEAPVNRFVADFIGETNLLPVGVASLAGGMARVVLPGGHEITCAAAQTGPGGTHHVSIRPERLTIAPAGTGDLTATVDRLIYLGTDLQVLARLADGTPLHLRMQNSARATPPEAGSPIGIVIEEGAARLLAD